MLVPNDTTAGKRNVRSANTAFGATASRLLDVPGGNCSFYFDNPMTDKPVNGSGRIVSRGTFGVGGYAADHPTLGALPQFIQQRPGCSLLKLCGVGFIVDDPIEWFVDGESAAIEIEGRAAPPSGRHRFRNQIFTNCGAGFLCLATPDEAHADMSIVDGCEFYNCGAMFRSENQQALNWKFNDCAINVLGDKETIVADLVRGGSITIDGLSINHNRCTLFRVQDFSPNNCKLICRDCWRDRYEPEHAGYLTILEFAGKDEWAIPEWLRCLEVTGSIPVHATTFDPEQLWRGIPEKYLQECMTFRTDGPVTYRAPPGVHLTFIGEPLK